MSRFLLPLRDVSFDLAAVGFKLKFLVVIYGSNPSRSVTKPIGLLSPYGFEIG